MKIENQFEVPLSQSDAWTTLLDIPRIAPCLPGTKLLDVEEGGRYRGEVQVRLGPVMLTFKGRAEIVERDNQAYTAKVVADGRDAKGRGGAKANVDFRLVPADSATRVQIETDLTLSGSIAQYGRASGMIEDVASHLIGEFAKCLRGEIGHGASAPASGAAGETAPKSAAETASASAEMGIAAMPESQPAALAASSRAHEKEEGAENPISGFRLGLWLMWRQLLRLFGRA